MISLNKHTSNFQVHSNLFDISLIARQKQGYIGNGNIEVVSHIPVDHLSGIKVKTGGKTAVEPGEVVGTTAIGHGRKQRHEDIA